MSARHSLLPAPLFIIAYMPMHGTINQLTKFLKPPADENVQVAFQLGDTSTSAKEQLGVSNT